MGVSRKTLREEGKGLEIAAASHRSGSPNTKASASDCGRWLQTFLAQLLLLLGIALFSKGQWGPALIVSAVYVVTLFFIAPGGPYYAKD